MPRTTPERHVAAAASVIIRHEGAALVRGRVGPPWSIRAEERRPLDVTELTELLHLASGPVDDRLATLAPGSPEHGVAAGLVDVLADYDLLTGSGAAVDAPSPAPAVSAVGSTGEPDTRWTLAYPVVLAVTASGYRAYAHDGHPLVDLTPREVAAVSVLGHAPMMPDAIAAQRLALGDRALSDADLLGLVGRLHHLGLVRRADDSTTENALVAEFRRAVAAGQALRAACDASHAAHDTEEARRERTTGVRRVKLVPVQVAGNIPPLSTGMLLSSIAAPGNDDLTEVYDPYPRWITSADEILGPDDGPAVYLFTNYLWSHEQNLDFAREVRERHPSAVLVHGGPDCPGYPADSERYLRDNPQVDIAVRGEGEGAIVDVLRTLAPTISGPDGPRLDDLRPVPGLAFLSGDEYVRTGDRPRLEDLNVVPSPYLTGVFDVFGATKAMGMAIIETNRGCPYGCSFCDWGSATNSRIRKLDLERVLAEFDWCARHEVPKVFIADANFGIFDRDVDIARHVVELRTEHGYPQRFISNYAKNTVKHLKQIVGILAAGGVVSEGLLSLQSMDTDTLAAIRRSNIKLDKYDALATEFRDSGMPLFVDLMIGLPGQTVESLHRDLQQCVDREVNAKVHATELLVNSPMNDPEYRTEFAVAPSRAPGATGKGADAAKRIGPALVVSTSSFTRDDYVVLDQMRRSYLLLENLGVARLVARFVRSETGLPEVDLYERIRADVTAEPARWPYLRAAILTVPLTMAPPVSWGFYRDDLHRYLAERTDVADDAALGAVLTTLHHILPAPGRAFPSQVELDHDVAAWYRDVLAAKHEGHIHDWPTRVGRVRDFGPAVLTVTDPNDVCHRNLGVGTSLLEYRDWELRSEIARAMPGHHRAM